MNKRNSRNVLPMPELLDILENEDSSIAQLILEHKLPPELKGELAHWDMITLSGPQVWQDYYNPPEPEWEEAHTVEIFRDGSLINNGEAYDDEEEFVIAMCCQREITRENGEYDYHDED